MTSARALVVPALKRHTSTVIVAHGLGDSGEGWIWLAENWRRRGKFEETTFIFPNAPKIPISVNGGYKMPGWYDIMSFEDIKQREDEPGIVKSQAYLHSLIAGEIEKGIPSERIVLGGFSQGGAMSIFSGLTCHQRLGGIFGLSCYLLLQGKVKDMIPAENPNKVFKKKNRLDCYMADTHLNQETKIFMGHGDADPVVKYEWGQKTAEKLQEWGWSVDFRTYKGLPHSADPSEIDHLEAYLKERVPDLGEQASKV